MGNPAVKIEKWIGAKVQANESPAFLPHWVSDLILVTVVLLLTLLPGPMSAFPAGEMGSRPLLWLLPAVGLGAAGLLFFRRRWPIAVFAISFLLYVLVALTKMPGLGPGIALVIVAFNLADRLSPKVAWAMGGTAALVIGAISVRLPPILTVEPQIFTFSAGVAMAIALGDSSRSRREYSAAMAERALRAEREREQEAARQVAEERLRIAQDLHDTVAHRISVISLNAGVASMALTQKPTEAKAALVQIREASREVLSEIGELLHYLRQSDGTSMSRLPQYGLDDVESLLAEFRSLGMRVGYEATGEVLATSATIQAVVYRILQEGLTNAHKHGAEKLVQVRLHRKARSIEVRVSNPVSSGQRNNPTLPSGKMGLIGLRERVHAAGGEFSHTSHTSHNGMFSIEAVIPTDPESQ